MVDFVLGAETFENFEGVVVRGFVDGDFLEAAGEGGVALEVAAVLFVGGHADAAEGAGREGWFEEV